MSLHTDRDATGVICRGHGPTVRYCDTCKGSWCLECGESHEDLAASRLAEGLIPPSRPRRSSSMESLGYLLAVAAVAARAPRPSMPERLYRERSIPKRKRPNPRELAEKEKAKRRERKAQNRAKKKARRKRGRR